MARRRSSSEAGHPARAQPRRREHGGRRRDDAARRDARRGAIAGELGLFEVDELWLDSVADAAASARDRARQPVPRPARPLRRARGDRRQLGGARWTAPARALVLNADDPLVADLGRERAEDARLLRRRGRLARAARAGARRRRQALPPLRRPYVFDAVYSATSATTTARAAARRARRRRSLAQRRRAAKACAAPRFTLHTPAGEAAVQLALPGPLQRLQRARRRRARRSRSGCRSRRSSPACRRPAPPSGAPRPCARPRPARRTARRADARRELRILLVKNPAGANEVLRTLALEPGEHDLLGVLNDQIADGRDVSWIWDADFELLAGRVAPRHLQRQPRRRARRAPEVRGRRPGADPRRARARRARSTRRAARRRRRRRAAVCAADLHGDARAARAARRARARRAARGRERVDAPPSRRGRRRRRGDLARPRVRRATAPTCRCGASSPSRSPAAGGLASSTSAPAPGAWRSTSRAPATSVTALDLDAGAARRAAPARRRAAASRRSCGDARAFALDRRDFALCLVPMQTIQLLGGAGGRARVPARARAHLRPAALLACAIVDDARAVRLPAGERRPVARARASVDGALYVEPRRRACSVLARDGRDRARARSRVAAASARAAGASHGASATSIELDRVSARELRARGARRPGCAARRRARCRRPRSTSAAWW